MKLLLDFFPIALFFIAYKYGVGIYEWGGHEYDVKGIYVATAVMIVATLIQTALTWFMHRKIEKMHVITLALVVILGGATIWLQDPEFIMWKPTVVNWLFAAGFIGAAVFTGKTLLERMMGEHISLEKSVWNRLNMAWILFFVLSGVLNLYVAFSFSEETWVNFKLFGLLGLTFIFIIAQSIYLSKHIEHNPESNGEA
jgi:intracellular septation protein